MKATELMIGDWVYYKYSSPKPWEPRKWQIVAFENSFIELADPDTLCKPIPLTPEILAKNGFVFNKNFKRYQICKNCIVIEFYSNGDNGELYGYNINHTNEIASRSREFDIQDTRTLYVHELQHALRLCGLDELADNFKV